MYLTHEPIISRNISMSDIVKIYSLKKQKSKNFKKKTYENTVYFLFIKNL